MISWPSPPLRAWYLYGWASSGWGITALWILSPVVLQYPPKKASARSVGYWAPDFNTPCTEDHPGGQDGGDAICKAKILGFWIDKQASYNCLYSKVVTILTQTILVLSLGPIADNVKWRKTLMVVTALLCSGSSMVFFFFPAKAAPSTPLITAAMNTIAYSALAISSVCLAAYLPMMARAEPEVVEASEQNKAERQSDGYGTMDTDVSARSVAHTSLLAAAEDLPVLARVESHIDPEEDLYQQLLGLAMSRISCYGNSIALAACLITSVLAASYISSKEGSLPALQFAVGVCGLWWLPFIIPAVVGLPGASKHDGPPPAVGLGPIIRALSPKTIRAMPNLYKYLVAWFFAIDAFHTLPTTLSMYAATRLAMRSDFQVILGMLPLVLGLPLTLVIPPLQRLLGYKNSPIVMWSVIGAALVPLYGALQILHPSWGINSSISVTIGMVIFGGTYCVFDSYVESVYAEMIPIGQESTYFSLLLLTDKSSSLLGPLVVGIIVQSTGSFNWAFVFIALQFLVPLPLLYITDVRQGVEQARRWVAQSKIEGEGSEADRLLAVGA